MRSRGSDGARRWPLRRVFGLIAGIAGVLTILAVALATVVLVRLTDARETLLDRIGPAVRAGQQLSAALVDQETGVRGFGMARGEEFLDPYHDGIIAEQRAVATLRELDGSGRVEGLGPDIADVEAAADAWRAEYAEPAIAATRSGAATGPAEAERGRLLFDEVRAASTNLLDDLESARVAARERLEAAARFVTAVGIAIAVVIVGFLTAAGIALRRAVLSPISQLADQVRRVVSGDVGRTVEGTGPREIAELGEDVDAMRVHILRELNAQQQINRRLDEQARDLERSNRDLEQFAYVASHDLQEPLRKVSSFCQLLQRRYGGQLDERADQYIEFAVDGAQRMQRLINDLLAFSRVGRTTAGFVPVELDAVARAAVASQETARAEAHGEVVIDELPQVPGDAALLQQLLANLIGNALKFRSEGVRPEVRISAAPADDGWEISVRDNGIGIEPEYADKVFVIFQRLHARDMYAGTGIGLALAKKIVEFHGGRIWVDTDPHDEPGATIRFTLPALPPVSHVTTDDPAVADGVAEKETV
ncbi:HAMP domain-containing protein [Pseudonocardia bannensis]|uniref:histidine kinase n=1 Tax=Pseudonocardia bannensis TaxID=630973 RepID=A0A848DDM3_9PSEU|nr:HAMP domain-containing protein [Pseudonocardia bannensis]